MFVIVEQVPVTNAALKVTTSYNKLGHEYNSCFGGGGGLVLKIEKSFKVNDFFLTWINPADFEGHEFNRSI